MATPEDAGSIYSDIRIRLDALTGDIKTVKTSFDNMNKTITSGSDTTSKTQVKNFDAVKLAGVASTVAITVAFKAAIKTFADTEQQLANVKAVSNATAAEFAQLEEAANNAGVTTRFTASEAADALFYLASAGLEATESVEALDGVLLLAGATGSGLAESAQAITATLSQYGLEASKAADVSNIFAAANSNSQATLEKLSGALQQVGPIAAGLGIGLEETVGSLEALFNAGYKGETAGRALKSALADLANESSETVKKLSALGISFSDVDPTVVGLTGAIGALEAAGITTSQTIDAFGKVAGGQLATLIGTGQAALEDYTQAVTDTDEAARQYAIQNDTLAGSQDAFKSALEGTSNSLIATLTPALRAIIDLGATFLRFLNSIPDIIKAVGTGAGTAALGIGVLTKALALAGITLAGPVGLIAAAAGVGIGLIALNKKLVDSRDRTDEMAMVTNELVSISNEYNEVTKKLEDNVSDLTKAQKAELETRQQLLALNLEKKLVEYAEEYKKLNEQIERETQSLEDAKQSQEDKLAYYDKLNTQDDRIIESKQKLIALEKKVSDGSATAQEAIMASTLKIALDSVASSEEQRIRNRERMVAGLNGEIVASEKSVNAAKTALAETTLAGQSSINAFAKAYNAGQISIEIYKTSNKGLYDQIVQVANEMKNAESSIDGVNSSLNEGSVDKATVKWQEYLKQMLGVDTAGSGVDAANEFVDGFNRQIESSKTVEQALNGSLENWDPSSQLQNKADSLSDALQDIFAVDPTTLDESFTTSNEAVQILVDSLRETQAEIKILADADAEQAEADKEKISNAKDVRDATIATYEDIQEKIKESTQTKRDALQEEYDESIAAAEALGKDTLAIEEYYREQNQALDDEDLERKKERDQEYKDFAYDLASSLYSSLVSARTDAIAGEIDAIETKAAAAIDAIDAETDALLTALGIQEATTLETLAEELAAAVADGDSETAAELQDEIDRTVIQEDAAARQLAIEEAAAEETAKLQYEADILEWNQSKLSTAVAGAQAAISAYGALAGIPVFGPALGIAAAAAVGSATAYQVGVIQSNKPTQSFATGGIVLPEAGKSLTGDQHTVGVNPGEAVFTKEQQATLLSLANGSGGSNNGPTMVQLHMDSKVVATGVARNFNNGIVKVVLK